MRCTKAQTMIIKKLAHELDTNACKMLNEHLGSCATCKIYLDQQDKLHQILRTSSYPAYPIQIHKQIMESIESRDHQRGYKLHLWLRQLPSALAIMLSLTFGTLVGVKSYHNQNVKYTQSESSSSTYASFGENSLLDDYNYGDSDE